MKCPNIKELDLSFTILTGSNNLYEIAKLCPKLQRITVFKTKIYISKKTINEFAQIIGPQLIKVCLYNSSIIFTKILFKYLKNIEEIDFTTVSKQHEKNFFHHLNLNRKNLKRLYWIPHHSEMIDFNDDMISVMQRISQLEIVLHDFAKFQFETNNLVELQLNSFQYLDVNVINEMTFNNLMKLTIKNFTENDFNAISKLIFPKLQSLYLNTYEVFSIPTPFINQVKHIKTFESNSIIPSIISSMKSFKRLINYECHEQVLTEHEFNNIVKSLEIISKHKSLENVKINFRIDCDYNTELFEKIANLCESKPKTKIVMKVYEVTNSHVPNQYKKAFEETRHLHKINMKMILL